MRAGTSRIAEDRVAAPPGTAPRRVAAGILRAIAVDRRPLDALIDSEGDAAAAALTPADRALARAIVATALRRQGQIQAALAALMAKPLPRRSGNLPFILEVAATQLLFMAVPDHAAVSIAVAEAARDPDGRHFKGVANGVLRTLARERDDILAGQDAARLNTPDWLFDRWVAHFGVDAATAIAAAHLSEPALDLTVKDDPAGWAARLKGVALPTGTVRLEAKGRIEALAGFAEGAWWIQDAAAALPARLAGDVRGKAVLDFCAAPGGKTAQLALAGAAVTAVDQSALRLRRLAENLHRLGLTAEAVAADARSYDPGRTFDAVLIDAPCSATGTIRRHPDIPRLKQPGDIAALATLQSALLDRAAALTAPGAVLVYATCSLEPEEGEHQVAAALSRLPLDLDPIRPGEIPGLRAEWIRDGLLRTLPSEPAMAEGAPAGMDGFFIARFRRK